MLVDGGSWQNRRRRIRLNCHDITNNIVMLSRLSTFMSAKNVCCLSTHFIQIVYVCFEILFEPVFYAARRRDIVTLQSCHLEGTLTDRYLLS